MVSVKMCLLVILLVVSSHNDSETVEFGSRYTFKDLSIGVTAASLKGNRPVFDPVMV